MICYLRLFYDKLGFDKSGYDMLVYVKKMCALHFCKKTILVYVIFLIYQINNLFEFKRQAKTTTVVVESKTNIIKRRIHIQ